MKIVYISHMKINDILLFLVLVFSITLSAQVNHKEWDGLLRSHVDAKGNVDYLGFKKSSLAFDAYLEALSKQPPQSAWSDAEVKAYWINAYNAFTVKMILNHYPLKSIMDIKYQGKSAWDHKWIKIGKETLSLNDIEHEKLRKRYKDARIHFVVNCASFSCPLLLNQAYFPDQLEKQMDAQTAAFLNDSARNRITPSAAIISQLFEWYKDDFVQDAGSVVAFINKYSKVKMKSNTKLAFMEYNWNLNGK